MLSRRVAAQLEIDEDQAFLCGLYHDLGKLILLGIVEDLLISRTLSEAPTLEELLPLLQTLHTRIGRKLSAQWKLPDNVTHTLSFHHEPEQSPEESRTLVAVVALADTLLGRIERDAPLPGSSALAESSAAWILKLRPQQLDALARSVEPRIVPSQLKVG